MGAVISPIGNRFCVACAVPAHLCRHGRDFAAWEKMPTITLVDWEKREVALSIDGPGRRRPIVGWDARGKVATA